MLLDPRLMPKRRPNPLKSTLHLLQKSFPNLVSKESVGSQERRFRARLCSCSCCACHDLHLLHWPCPLGPQQHLGGLFCLRGVPGDLPKAAVLGWDVLCPVSIPHWGWMCPPGDASISPLPTMGPFTPVLLPAKLWLRLSASLCWLN